jgi:tRNA nucleotidyltransferase (CCA-adding enzyme)
MFSLSSLHYLAKQHTFIQKKLRSDKAVFLVWWCVRDLLLGINQRPLDIDATVAGDPLALYSHSNKVWLSHFITEKFGTMTFIKKGNNHSIQYEITPLRTESWYEDFRHPGEIHRSNNILLDAKRRDFTINALYFFSDGLDTTAHHHQDINIADLLDALQRHWIYAIAEAKTLIIQQHSLIEQLFGDGYYHKEQLSEIISTYNLWKESDFHYFIIDPNKGIQDIAHRTLRAVGNPDHRFQEDALRLLRAIRFVNVLNHQLKSKQSDASLFDFDKSTWNAVKKNHHLIEYVAKERIKDEIIKIFSAGDPFGCIALLDESRMLQFLFPSLYATKYVHQPVRFHPFDVYTHTLLTLYELQKINSNYLVRLGMLYHDVGKVAQFSAYKDELSKDEIRSILSGSLNHRKWWPELVKNDFAMLGFSSKEIEQIAWYVANHHKPEEVLDGEDGSYQKKKLRKFLSEAGYQRVNDILDITIADRRGQYNPLQNNSDLQEISHLRKLLDHLHDEEWQFTPKHLAIDGNDIIKYFNLKPSQLIGELLKQWFDWVLADIASRNKKKAILEYLSGYLKNKYQPISQ